jgi:predicted amidohydrolase
MNAPLRLAALAQGIARVGSLAAWEALVEARIAEAAAAGAELLLMPEYGSMELAGAWVGKPDLARELEVVVAHAGAILETWRRAAMRHRVWLAPGSLPARTGGTVRNRAPLIAPDGGIAFQDKRVMTRFEAERWNVAPGAPPAIFETPWGRIGLAICFDCEFPNLVRAQAEAGAWLILVPSCTDTLAGFNRVRLSARARALENQCYVAVAPTVGEAPWLGTLDENRGYAAVFGPVDRGFPDDGVIARGAPDRPGWVHATLDPAALARVRREGQVRNAELWQEKPPPCPVLRPAAAEAAAGAS